MFMSSIKPQFTECVQPQFNEFEIASSTMSSLAERVTEAIRDSEVSIPQVAKSCGISVQAVYKWMSGLSKTIAGEHLIELADLTNFEARWIINGKGAKRRDPKVVAILYAMENMPEYKKDVIVSTSTALAVPAEHKQNGTQ